MAEWTVDSILAENDRRNNTFLAPINPITGENSTFFEERIKVHIEDFPVKDMYLMPETVKVPLISRIIKAGSIEKFFKKEFKGLEYTESERLKIIEQFTRIRFKDDFPFWAYFLAFIKNKGGGEDVLFKLNYPQKKLVEEYERDRRAGKPIRLIILKARQWGGSTATQIYMSWLQLIHMTGLNSLIVAHQATATDEIADMFKRLIFRYPIEYLYEIGANYNANESKFVGVGTAGNIHRVPQRNFKIKLGTAERPDSARGGDYNLVHLSEVGLWKKTEGKKPSDIVRSATSGIPLAPYTMIVYESTANGTGTFFADEYEAAKRGESQFRAFFVPWFIIELYRMQITDVHLFAAKLLANRNNTNVNSSREESGQYLFWLWEQGASLEGINWYISERAKYSDHGEMAAEYPSDDVEAFVHSGFMVFDKYQVEKFRKTCKPPKYVGDMYADDVSGPGVMDNLRFLEDRQGKLWIWDMPEPDTEEEIVKNRYLVIVDIGGTNKKSDWSVILVLDRLFQMDGGVPVVVAQWYGHIDMDLLSWKAAQIAKFYNNALLVIESNTLETHDKNRKVDGDQSLYILNLVKSVYSNLYTRKQSEDEIRNHIPKKYGFHTNIATKPKLISTLKTCIREESYIERDVRCVDEYLTYEQKPDNSFGAIIGKHDDLLMTRAIGLEISYHEMPLPTIVTPDQYKFTTKKSISAASFS